MRGGLGGEVMFPRAFRDLYACCGFYRCFCDEVRTFNRDLS